MLPRLNPEMIDEMISMRPGTMKNGTRRSRVP